MKFTQRRLCELAEIAGLKLGNSIWGPRDASFYKDINIEIDQYKLSIGDFPYIKFVYCRFLNWNPQSDMYQAMDIAESLRVKGIHLTLEDCVDHWQASFSKFHVFAVHESSSTAICLAALQLEDYLFPGGYKHDSCACHSWGGAGPDCIIERREAAQELIYYRSKSNYSEEYYETNRV